MSAVIHSIEELPKGRAPQPVKVPHFPDPLHTTVWRNWDVIDVNLLAEVLRGTPEQITEMAKSMGLPPQRKIDSIELRRNYATILRRNWHLLPYEQICQILGWDAAQMQFMLNEDDFLWVKLGGFKPECAPVYYQDPNAEQQSAAQHIAQVVQEEIGETMHAPTEPLFGFIERFDGTRFAAQQEEESDKSNGFPFCMVYPYFLRYGDPLRGEGINDIPEGYLSELAASGVTAIWIQAVLNTLAPWELAPELSIGWEERIANLNKLVERCRKFGIEVLLYLNEPRAMPRAFYETYPELRGVEEPPDRRAYTPDVVALCTSTQPVQDFLVNSTRHIFEQVPGLGGLFVITFSENLTNCYSREYDSTKSDEFALMADINEERGAVHEQKPCPRCEARGPEVVNAEVCTLLERGMRQAGSDGKLVLYYWSTPEAWLPGMLEHLPKSTWLQVISEWGKEFTRGDYTGLVNEYTISVVGPSEQSLREWALAREAGLKVVAKMQAVNTYEFSSIPYIPALRLVAEHLTNVTETGVDGVTLGWTAGGSPSPNLDLVREFARNPLPSVEEAMLNVATRIFGVEAAPIVVDAWNAFSDAYAEFPFDLTVCYWGPQSHGPANLLWSEPTGFAASMCTYPWDHLDGWRGPYSPETFQHQFEIVAELWQKGVDILDELRKTNPSPAVEDEWRVALMAKLHFRSTANQARYVREGRDNPAIGKEIIQEELTLARRLMDLVADDSRLGFEATNHYGYIRIDLAEKILNCRQLLAELE